MCEPERSAVWPRGVGKPRRDTHSAGYGKNKMSFCFMGGRSMPRDWVAFSLRARYRGIILEANHLQRGSGMRAGRQSEKVSSDSDCEHKDTYADEERIQQHEYPGGGGQLTSNRGQEEQQPVTHQMLVRGMSWAVTHRLVSSGSQVMLAPLSRSAA